MSAKTKAFALTALAVVAGIVLFNVGSYAVAYAKDKFASTEDDKEDKED